MTAPRAIDGSVSIIDSDLQKVIATVPVDGEIVDLAVTRDGTKLYLAMSGPKGAEQQGLKKVMVTDGHPVSWVPRTRPRAVIFTPDGQRAYVKDGFNWKITLGRNSHALMTGVEFFVCVADGVGCGRAYKQR
jgi:DNA-binding beta-propeller fold protein YncE